MTVTDCQKRHSTSTIKLYAALLKSEWYTKPVILLMNKELYLLYNTSNKAPATQLELNWQLHKNCKKSNILTTMPNV